MFSNSFGEEDFLRDERHVPGCGSSTRLSRKNLTRSEINKRKQLSQSLIGVSRNGKPIAGEMFHGRYNLSERVALVFFVVGFFDCGKRFGWLDFPVVVCNGRNGFGAL